MTATPSDVADDPSQPSEDGAEPPADPGENPGASSEVEDSSTTAPLDADEGDPDPENSVPAG